MNAYPSLWPKHDRREQLDESVRLTWSEETRDEVLARLLELNRVMAAREAEAAQGGGGGEDGKGVGGRGVWGLFS